ncbi:MAG: virulence RhuM family protein [Elusimicrobiota bacterium]|jgi:hypothetical protein|nr:virulence RhuM family protein [Elusimicrobiota bacterium]
METKGITVNKAYKKRLTELKTRIRQSQIKAALRVNSQKITDIYATALDYDPTEKTTGTEFCKINQYKAFAICRVINYGDDGNKPHRI